MRATSHKKPEQPLVYLGTSPFAAVVLRRLAASPFAPALVVAPPDRPKGRGRRLSAPAVATSSGLLVVLGTVGAVVAVRRITAVDPLTALGAAR